MQIKTSKVTANSCGWSNIRKPNLCNLKIVPHLKDKFLECITDHMDIGKEDQSAKKASTSTKLAEKLTYPCRCKMC